MATMSAVVLTGHGGLDKLQWRDDMPIPEPEENEVLIKVAAAAVNNTDINTRIGWYSKSVTGDTGAGALSGFDSDTEDDGSWSGVPLRFPRIQGADCCGEIVDVGAGVDKSRIGERVLVRTLQSTGAQGGDFHTWTFGSECDGGFAHYTKTFAHDAVAVDSDLSSLELATFPCAYSTAEGMLQRARIRDERILITGASGGVGSAAIQLAKMRGAHVTAMTSAAKADSIRALGADAILLRDDEIEQEQFDAVVDLVAGPRWPSLINSLKRGGRYVVSGAIAGPMVPLDVRTLYLRDLTLYGSTFQPNSIFEDLVGYIQAGRLKPMVAETYRLKDMKAAQESFLDKGFIGKIAIDVAGS